MREERYLVINSQNGEARLRKSPSVGFGEFCVKLVMEWDDATIPVVELRVPAPPVTVMTAEVKEYGVPWALAEGILTVVSVSSEGQLEVDYTDAGLKRLFDACKAEWGIQKEECWWQLQEFAVKKWGLPRLYVHPKRWEPLFEDEGNALSVGKPCGVS